MLPVLEELFKDKSSNFMPMPWLLAVEVVLVPELTILLIMEDMEVGLESARLIHQQSRQYGILKYPFIDHDDNRDTKRKDCKIELEDPDLPTLFPSSQDIIDLTGDD